MAYDIVWRVRVAGTLSATLKDSVGTPVDLSGFTVTMLIKGTSGNLMRMEKAASVVGGQTVGGITVTFSAADFGTGKLEEGKEYMVVFKAEQGATDNRYPSNGMPLSMYVSPDVWSA